MAKKKLSGKVVKLGQKSVTIQFDIYEKHPKYLKMHKITRKMHVHDENGMAKLGEIIEIEECRPTSKTKSFKVSRVIK